MKPHRSPSLAAVCVLVFVSLPATGCRKKNSGAGAVCERAADRYTECVEKMLGAEMAEVARAKRREGVAACREDGETQAMYTKCLPGASCEAFLECLEKEARAPGAALPAGADRAERCAQYVREGQRGIAMQVVMLGEERDEASKRRAQRCVMDESNDWTSCLEEEERARVIAYGEQRQRDCESWEPALAACILELEGAKDCNPDEYPLWREPIPEGAAGPKIAWSVELGSGAERLELAWAPGGVLVVTDGEVVRAFRQGRERWRAEVSGRHLVVTTKRVAVASEDGGVTVLDGATGEVRSTALESAEIRGLAAAGSQLIALAADGRVFRIDADRCPGARCVRPDGELPPEQVPYEASLAAIEGGTLVVRGEYSLLAFDRRRALTFRLRLGNDDEIEWFAAGPKHLALTESMGVALLEPGACAAGGDELYLPFAAYLDEKLGYRVGGAPEDCPRCKKVPAGCVTAYRGSVNGEDEALSFVGGGAVAFNDHGIVIEKTHLLTPDGGGWEVQSGGRGRVAGDAKHVYTVSVGRDDDAVRILALSRADGSAAWQTQVPAAPAPISSEAAVVLDGERLAARIGDAIHVLEL